MMFTSKAITSLLLVAGTQAFTAPSPKLNNHHLQNQIRSSSSSSRSSRFMASTMEPPTTTTTSGTTGSDESMDPKAWDCDEDANCVQVDACDEEVCRTSLDVRIHGEWYDLSG